MNAHVRPWHHTPQGMIAILAAIAIVLALALPLFIDNHRYHQLPLYFAYLFGGVPLVWNLVRKLLRGEFGSDLLAGISIVVAALLDQYLAGVVVILMLSSGEAIELYALRRASAVLDALAQRLPHLARRHVNGVTEEISLDEVQKGDILELLPHDIAPVDGIVIEGHGSMDESYLTGEPFKVRKIPGSAIISGAINGESLLRFTATALPVDSRYQKIAKVIESQAGKQVPMRRLGDRLGAWYTPLAVTLASIAWAFSGDPLRFLAVLVVATPCPLLLAIPIAIIGAISDCARRGIIIKNPAALEHLRSCRTAILDKTGTLTYGRARVTSVECRAPYHPTEVLRLVAAIEYSPNIPSLKLLSKLLRFPRRIFLQSSQSQKRRAWVSLVTARGRSSLLPDGKQPSRRALSSPKHGPA